MPKSILRTLPGRQILSSSHDADPHDPVSESSLSLDDCHRYVYDDVFRFRSPLYTQDHPGWPGEVGLEVEMIPLSKQTKRRLTLQGDKPSLAWTLDRLAKQQSWHTSSEQNDGGRLLTLVKMDQGDQLSFEPGGQLEFSSRPYPCLSDALDRLREVQGLIDEALAGLDARAVQIGMDPWQGVDDVGLQMPKARYAAMNDYYDRISHYGRKMMRLTCTIQVCLDFGPDEETMVRRFLAGQLLAPFATGIFAFSPYLQSKNTGCKSYRSRVWRHLDPTHTGVCDPAKLLTRPTKQQCVDCYASFAVAADVVFVEALNYEIPPQGFSFGQWVKDGYKGVFPTLRDFETHLSLLFPEVRPRGFLELRSIDSQARVWQTVPAAFYCGLLYDDANLEWILENLQMPREELETLLAASENGLAHPKLARYSHDIYVRAMEGFQRLPDCFGVVEAHRSLQAFYGRFVSRSRSPADDLLDGVRASSFSLADYDRLEHEWRELVNG